MTIDPGLTRISELAKNVRAAMECMPRQRWPFNFGAFPQGKCDDASRVLGAVFVDNEILGFEHLGGWRGGPASRISHVWLQRGNLVVDITADQFTECDLPVIVSEDSPMHRTFDLDPPGVADFREVRAHELFPVFDWVKHYLESLVAAER